MHYHHSCIFHFSMHLHTTSQPAVHRVARVYGGRYCHCRWHRGHTWSYVLFCHKIGAVVRLGYHHRGWTGCGRGYRHRAPRSHAHVPQKAKMTEHEHATGLFVYMYIICMPLMSLSVFMFAAGEPNLYAKTLLVFGKGSSNPHCTLCVG